MRIVLLALDDQFAGTSSCTRDLMRGWSHFPRGTIDEIFSGFLLSGILGAILAILKPNSPLKNSSNNALDS